LCSGSVGANGQDGWVWLYDDSGTVSGFAPTDPEHKLHRFGMVAGVGGVAESHGFCDQTDPDGDHVLWKNTPGMRRMNSTVEHGMSVIVAGAGKYAGVTRWSEFTCLGSGTPEAYQNKCEYEGVITLPK
jgi:hypothetical protein